MNINDIAKLAGVSKTTVSRVLNNRPDVNKKTATRINTLINAVGYTPNALAKAITEKRSKTVGLVIPYKASFIFSSQYYVELLRGISTLFDERCYYLMFCYPKDGNYIEFYRQGRVDGFILISHDFDHANILDHLLETQTPFVSTVDFPNYSDKIAYVDIDNYACSQTVMEYLINLGHTHIAYVGESSIIGALRRGDAYRDCLHKNNIPFRDEYFRLSASRSQQLIQSGYLLAKELMSLPEPPTAIFCSADTLAIGVNRAIHELGLKIPQDVSLVGFDGDDVGRYLNPPLTTVVQSAFDKGYIAAQSFLNYLENGTPMQSQRLTNAYLDIRSSTAPPKFR